MRICSSSHGWLIMANDDTFEVALFNPFSGKFIDIPRIGGLGFDKLFLDRLEEMEAIGSVMRCTVKGVLSANPTVNQMNMF